MPTDRNTWDHIGTHVNRQEHMSTGRNTCPHMGTHVHRKEQMEVPQRIYVQKQGAENSKVSALISELYVEKIIDCNERSYALGWSPPRTVLTVKPRKLNLALLGRPGVRRHFLVQFRSVRFVASKPSAQTNS